MQADEGGEESDGAGGEVEDVVSECFGSVDECSLWCWLWWVPCGCCTAGDFYLGCGFYLILVVEEIVCGPTDEGEAVLLEWLNVFTHLIRGERNVSLR